MQSHGHQELQWLLDWLHGWLPGGCGVAAAAVIARAAGEFADEEQLIANAVDKRRREFRAGRAAARQALAAIGCAPVPILARAQRDPIWPPGCVGSITHSGRFALAITAPTSLLQAVGVDLEDDSALEPGLARMVCSAEEMAQQAQLAALGIDLAKLCFVAKEAAFKAIFPRQRRMLEFQQLRIAFAARQGSFRVCQSEAAEPGYRPVAGNGAFICQAPFLAAAFVTQATLTQAP
jgi:4'-phosphopantetheinyl transferase EntD